MKKQISGKKISAVKFLCHVLVQHSWAGETRPPITLEFNEGGMLGNLSHPRDWTAIRFFDDNTVTVTNRTENGIEDFAEIPVEAVEVIDVR
ncbi:MAG: hypothetical protein E6R04_01110 [Spirochaetes bacterium]|nr:MAG: hypothetical protein E6R04_01110 [Spirochaetota bacterium]